ncbi:hypothetical protein Tco_0259983 [Tanacetum coccineum]
MYKSLYGELSQNLDYLGLEVSSIRRIQGIGYGVLGFLGVGTTFDIFQNINIVYLEYGILSFSGYGVLSFIPLWSLVIGAHGLAPALRVSHGPRASADFTLVKETISKVIPLSRQLENPNYVLSAKARSILSFLTNAPGAHEVSCRRFIRFYDSLTSPTAVIALLSEAWILASILKQVSSEAGMSTSVRSFYELVHGRQQGWAEWCMVRASIGRWMMVNGNGGEESRGSGYEQGDNDDGPVVMSSAELPQLNNQVHR